MLRLPVDWEIKIAGNLISGFQDFPKLTLNKEWEIEYLENGNSLEQRSMTITRKNTSEEMLVSGSFSYLSREQQLITHEFAKVMGSGSSSITIPLKNLQISKQRAVKFGQFSFTSPSTYNVRGMIYITSTREKTDDLASNECKNWQSLEELSKDFERLLDPQTSSFPDFNIKCGDVLIPSHKNILSARSVVFAAMLANDMKENHENQVVIADLDESVVRSMLTFMYTGKTTLTVALASDLLFAASKYQMDDLKRVCCDFLKKNVSTENMLRIYVMGDLHNEDLKSFVEDYLCKMCSDFSVFEATEEWKTFRKEKPNLALDLAIALVKSRDCKSNDRQPI